MFHQMQTTNQRTVKLYCQTLEFIFLARYFQVARSIIIS